MHLLTNHWSYWAQIRWAKSLWVSSGGINFLSFSTKLLPFPVLWFVEQFPCICRQRLIRFCIDSVPKLILGLHWPELILVPLKWILIIFWPLIGGVVSKHLQTKHWWDLAQIWWTNSLRASLSPINFWSCFAESQLWFLGLWFNPSGGLASTDA